MAIKFEPHQEQPQQEETYTVGDTFLRKNKDPYIINRGGDNNVVILSCITDGDNWNDPIRVDDDQKITQSEFEIITGGQSHEFTQRDFKIILI